MPLIRRLASKRSEWSSLYGQVISPSSCVERKCSATVSTAIFDATSPDAWPPMPSATMARRSASGRKKLSSLCWRFMPMLVSPEKRTRMERIGKEELIGRGESYHGPLRRHHLLAGGVAGQADEAQLGTGAQHELALADVRVAVDDVLQFLATLTWERLE